MPTFRLSRISNPGLLAKIAPDRLLHFLEPTRAYLEGRGFEWPQPAAERIDYRRLGHLLHFPKDGLPPEMVVPLVLVDEMSTDLQMDRLLAGAARYGIELDLAGNNSPSDIAVQAWLTAPRLLEELHAENYTIRQKNFRYFAGIGGEPRAFPKAGDEVLRALERDLDDCFEHYQRGRGSRAFIFDHGRRVWILVRRGATFKREESMRDGGEPDVQVYRPMTYDVLVYDTETDDLGLHVETRWQERMYLHCLGLHVFGDPDYFPSSREITFDPLVRHGAKALSCDDVPGMKAVKLVEVHKRWNNDQNEIDIKKADDIFAVLGDRYRDFLGRGTLTKVVFRVWFEGADKPRSVTVRWPNVTQYERDGDSEAIELWLTRRGFMPRARGHALPPVKRLWRALGLVPGAATSRFDWQALLEEAWPSAAPLLRATGATAMGVRCPSPGGDGCSRRVVRHAGGRIVAACGDPEGQCDPVELTLDDIVVHELDLDKLAEALCGLLGLDGELRPLPFAGPVWQIGWYEPVAGERFAAALVLPVGSDQVRDAAVRLRGHYDRPFLLLTPTRGSIEPTTVEYLRAGRSRALCLEEVLGLGTAGEWQLLRPREQLLRDFRRDVLGEVRFGKPEHRFPTPPGTGWEHVAMRFINGHEVAIRVHGREGGVFHYAHMGMTKTNKDEPTVQWDLLHDLAEGRGEFLWPRTRPRRTMRKRRERLVGHLRDFFGIDGDPFGDLPGGRGFKARFTIAPEP